MADWWMHGIIAFVLVLVVPIVSAFISGNRAENALRNHQSLNEDEVAEARKAIDEREVWSKGLRSMVALIAFLLFWIIFFLAVIPSVLRSSPQIGGGGFGG